MYRSLTNGIQVTVEPFFLEDESDPDSDYYFWAYTVEILNLSAAQIQLLTRHWEIVSDTGQTQTVNGDGVIGEEPIIAPGAAFEYTSGAPLTTPSGLMRGSYYVETAQGEGFKVTIPAFSLDSPHAARILN